MRQITEEAVQKIILHAGSPERAEPENVDELLADLPVEGKVVTDLACDLAEDTFKEILEEAKQARDEGKDTAYIIREIMPTNVISVICAAFELGIRAGLYAAEVETEAR